MPKASSCPALAEYQQLLAGQTPPPAQEILLALRQQVLPQPVHAVELRAVAELGLAVDRPAAEVFFPEPADRVVQREALELPYPGTLPEPASPPKKAFGS